MTWARLQAEPPNVDETDMFRVRILSATVVMAVALAASAVIGAPAAHASVGSDEATMFALTNQARAAVGLPGLQWDPSATLVARQWSQQMAAAGTLSHNPNMRTQIEQVAPDWTHIGENVGFASSPQVVEPLFEKSPGHYANITGDYNRVGIGVARDANGTMWVTLDFIKASPINTIDPAAFSPFTSAQSLVAQQYVDLLGRQPDQAGLAYWSNLIYSGAMDGADVASAFLTTSEFSGQVGPLVKLYYTVFNRLPDASGLLFWLGAARGGQGLEQIAGEFMQTTEFQQQYGGKTLSQAISIAYQHVLGRTPDSQGLAYWQNLIQSGQLTFAGFLVQLTMSNELGQRLGASPQVTMVYVGMLRRTPDPSGFAYWVNQVNNGQSLAGLTTAFFYTPEYASRF